MSSFVKKYDAYLDETYYYMKHNTGLEIYVMPKELSTSYAMLTAKYGSFDNRFAKKGAPMTEMPEGIAHFLEHKLFESEDGDAFTRYSETGASANAYTSFDRTCYLFSCSDRFYDNLYILLDFVTHPYFTEQTVNKEQGIIAQEIKMYDDSPYWRVLFNMLEKMYYNHPVRVDIAGTVESISKITDKLLYKCYNTFYDLSNMFVCVAGNVKSDEVIDFIDFRLINFAVFNGADSFVCVGAGLIVLYFIIDTVKEYKLSKKEKEELPETKEEAK